MVSQETTPQENNWIEIRILAVLVVPDTGKLPPAILQLLHMLHEMNSETPIVVDADDTEHSQEHTER